MLTSGGFGLTCLNVLLLGVFTCVYSTLLLTLNILCDVSEKAYKNHCVLLFFWLQAYTHLAGLCKHCGQQKQLKQQQILVTHQSTFNPSLSAQLQAGADWDYKAARDSRPAHFGTAGPAGKLSTGRGGC